MARIMQIQKWCSLFSAILMYAVSQRLSMGENILSIPYANEVFGIALALTSSLLAEFMTNLLFGLRFIRKFILGQQSIEGYWLLRTEPYDENDTDNPLLKNGVAWINLDWRIRKYKIITTRLRADGAPGSIRTLSRQAHFWEQEDGAWYLNFFDLGGSADHPRQGVVFGRVVRANQEKNQPTHIDSSITLHGEKYIRNQTGIPISANEVKKYVKDCGPDGWIVSYLLDLESDPKRVE